MEKPATVLVVGATALLALGLFSGAGGARAAGELAPSGPATAPVQLAQAGSAMRPVSWSENQVARGEKLFKEVCADCHGASLRGGMNGGPPLTGSAFTQKYLDGTPVSALFAFSSNLMPPDGPGQYSPAEYVDLIAFILRENGIESSGAPMPTNPVALDKMIVQK